MKIYYLEPQSGYKTPLRSDTLWGTICWAIRSIYGITELENLIQSYVDGTPAFVISSTFPYKQIAADKKLFFPRPILIQGKKEGTQGSSANSTEGTEPKLTQKLRKAGEKKKARKIQFINQDYFEGHINGELSVPELESIYREEHKEISVSKYDKVPYEGNPELFAPKVEEKLVTHNTIDRRKGGGTLTLDNGGQLFHTEEHYLKDPTNVSDDKANVGLYFLAKGTSEGIKMLDVALRYLQHIGIGGDRNTGKGFFRITRSDKDFVLREPKEPNALTCLSLYYPSYDELVYYQEPSSREYFNYELEIRKGRLGFLARSKYKKPALQMFKEGATFPFLDQPYYGRIKKIMEKEHKDNPDYDVYQYGYGFMIKMHLKP